MGMYRETSILLLLLIPVISSQYYGALLANEWIDPSHDVSGSVYIADEKTIIITGFTYDGAAPDSFFYLGKRPYDEVTGPAVDAGAVIIPDETGSSAVLGSYNNENIKLTLPSGMKITDFTYISVWCRQFDVYFGGVVIPAGFDPPAPQELGGFIDRAHDVTGSVTVLDDKTIQIKDFTYDGQGPDAYFYVGNTQRVSEQQSPYGRIPDETGSPDILGRYRGDDITLTLPDGLSVQDLKWLSVWCVRFSANFGEIRIPANLNVPPSIEFSTAGEKVSTTSEGNDEMNCEELSNDLQVSWLVEGDRILFQLAGSIDDDEYMAFGLSGSDATFSMIGADVIVAQNHQSQPSAVDYYLSGYAQCASNGFGACPDTRRGDDDDVQDVTYEKVDGIAKIKYSRALKTGDSSDKEYKADGTNQQIVWGIGPVNSAGEVAKHTKRITEPKAINFGRSVRNNCGAVVIVEEIEKPDFLPHELSGDDTKTFTFEIGLSGADQGYKALTGFPSWGIAWYVNGILVPELYLTRGETYTFRVAGGTDENNGAQYHPLYITSSELGGLGQSDDSDETVFPGRVNRETSDKVVGDYCEWKLTEQALDEGKVYSTFEEMKADMLLDCNGKSDPEYGMMKWTPDENTPDTVYYQCYTHRNLGWKIHLSDPKPEAPSSTTEEPITARKPRRRRPTTTEEPAPVERKPSTTEEPITARKPRRRRPTTTEEPAPERKETTTFEPSGPVEAENVAPERGTGDDKADGGIETEEPIQEEKETTTFESSDPIEGGADVEPERETADDRSDRNFVTRRTTPQTDDGFDSRTAAPRQRYGWVFPRQWPPRGLFDRQSPGWEDRWSRFRSGFSAFRQNFFQRSGCSDNNNSGSWFRLCGWLSRSQRG